MLHFLRRIRRGLINTGATRKYLLYAVGEILLVMIGILLALQVNNWNLKRLQKIDEINILKDIKKGFQTDKRDIGYNMNFLNNANKSINIIFKSIEENQTYHDSLDFHFATSITYAKFIGKEQAFDLLKSKGFSIISNKKLKDDIVNLYDFRYQQLIDFQDGAFIPTQTIRTFCINHFDVVASHDLKEIDGELKIVPGEMKPVDFDELKKNDTYRRLLNNQFRHNKLYNHMSNRPTFNKLEELIVRIDDEILLLEN